MQETRVQSLGQEDALEKEVTTYSSILWASLIAQLVKNRPAVQEILVRFLCGVDILKKASATHSSILGLLWWLR